MVQTSQAYGNFFKAKQELKSSRCALSKKATELSLLVFGGLDRIPPRLWRTGGGFVCADDVAGGWPEVAATVAANSHLGFRHPWVIVVRNASRPQLECNVGQKVFVLALDTGQVWESYRTGTQVVKELGILEPLGVGP